MNANFFLNNFKNNHSKDAIIWKDSVFSYGWLYDSIIDWDLWLKRKGVIDSDVVVIEGDFSPNSISLFFSLLKLNCIIVPLTDSVSENREKFIEISNAKYIISINSIDEVMIESMKHPRADNNLYKILNQRKHSGLVLFSSGSTGESKAAVHDLEFILDKFKVKKRAYRSITFLLYDHIGGVNTMLYILSNGGCIITAKNRTPDSVLKLIEKYNVELLPTSPTFLNLILLSEAYKNYRLDSLKVITYGTEPMPENTLLKINSLYPKIKLQQTYGLSEVGILRSKSKDSKSLWVKIGGEGFETRVANGLLEIKAKSAMLGYLNAPSPFTEDGWFKTGDEVDVEGEYFLIKGRKSEIINVGGEKVYPQEVENTILGLDYVLDVLVYGESHPIIGNIVVAEVYLNDENKTISYKNDIKKYCFSHLDKYKVPAKIKLMKDLKFSKRFKKKR
tara:strand:+ start:310 stop:1650 length:1341 start_codon:yes stop_codon:yes gene_type:complete